MKTFLVTLVSIMTLALYGLLVVISLTTRVYSEQSGGVDSLEFVMESFAPLKCIHGPLNIVRGRQSFVMNSHGVICAPSRSKLHLILLPTGTLMLINDEGYAWPIVHFLDMDYEAPRLVERH